MSVSDALNWLVTHLNPYVAAGVFAGYFVAVGRLLYLTQRPPRAWESPWERQQREAQEESLGKRDRSEARRAPVRTGSRS